MTGLTGKELHTTREPVTRLAGWLAAWGMAGWLRPRKAREAQRGPERRTVDRISLSGAWLEAPHKQICDQGGSPQISSRNQRGSPAYYHHVCRVPNRNPLQTQGLPTSSQGSSPQAELCTYVRPAELRPGRPTHKKNYVRPGSWLFGWLVE